MQVNILDRNNKNKVLPSQKKEVKRGDVHIIEERCKECQLCIDFCPMDVLVQSEEVNDKGYHIPKLEEEPEKGKRCIACGFCQIICPEYAIWVEEIEDNGG